MKSISADEQALIRHVEKICESPEFHSKQVLCRFLSYIVSETLAGRGEEIKAFSIGVDVFNKDADFDPGQDTLVRINAGRLRRMLDLYYSNTGKNDDLRIRIPKGGYVPLITEQSDPGEEEINESSQSKESRMSLEPSIAVLSFKDLWVDSKKTYFAHGFSYELLVELTKFEDLQVYNYLSVTDHPDQGAPFHKAMMKKGIRFSVGGAIHGDKDRINVLVELHDLFQGKQIWCERHSINSSAENFIEIQEKIALDISRKLGSEYGIILRQLSQDAQSQKPQKWSTYTAVLKYYNYLSHTTPESAQEAFEALNRAMEVEPQSAVALSFLAAMHGTAYALDYPDSDTSYKASGELAERAHILDPHNLFVQLSLAFKCFLFDEKERFFHIADRMLGRNPESALRLGALGFHLSLYGDWERGKQILDSVMHDHLEYPRYFHGATTLFYYRDKSYEMALTEAKKYKVSGFFWGPMLRAMVLGQLSRKQETETEVQHLRQMKPDFEKRARYLISRFVKEEPMVEHIVDGLQKAGLNFQ